MTIKKTAGRPPAPRLPANPPARAFERQAPPAPRLQPAARDARPADPADDARPADPPAAPPRRSARDVILRLVETLKEL